MLLLAKTGAVWSRYLELVTILLQYINWFLCKEVFFSVNHAGTVSDEWAVKKVSVNWWVIYSDYFVEESALLYKIDFELFKIK